MFVNREKELDKITKMIDDLSEGRGHVLWIEGAEGIGKSALLEEVRKICLFKGFIVLYGKCLEEVRRPYYGIAEALKYGNLEYLVHPEHSEIIAIYIIYHKKGLLMAKREKREMPDADIFASVFNAVQKFVDDSLRMIDSAAKSVEGYLDVLGYGEYRILVLRGKYVDIILVVTGRESERLKYDLLVELNAYEESHEKKLRMWKGENIDTDELLQNIEMLVSRDKAISTEVDVENIMKGLHNLSLDRPIAILVDDLQWADVETLNTLRYLVRTLKKYRVLFIFSSRPIRGASRILRHSYTLFERDSLIEERMELSNFSEKDTEKMVKKYYYPNTFPNRFYSFLHRESGGVPLYIVEMLKTLEADKTIERFRGAWHLVGDVESYSFAGKLRSILNVRLEGLSAFERSVIEVAAVEGEVFHAEILMEILDEEKLKILRALHELELFYRLIKKENNHYKFVHKLLRDLIYEDLDPELRREYHRAIAEALLNMPGKNNLYDIAGHFYMAGDDRALEYVEKAAHYCAEKGFHALAEELFMQAYELKNDLNFLVDAAEQASCAGMVADAVRIYEKILKIKNNDEIKRRYAYAVSETGDFKKAEEIAIESIVGMEGMEKARMHGVLGRIYALTGRCEDAIPHLKEYIKYAKMDNHIRDLSEGYRNLGIAYSNLNRLEEAEKCYILALEYAEKLGDSSLISSAVLDLGTVYSDEGYENKAVELYKLSMEISEADRDKHGVSVAMIDIGLAYMAMGMLEEALETFLKCLEIKEEIGDQVGLSWTHCGLAEVYERMLEPKRAREHYEISLQLREMLGDALGAATTHINIARLKWLLNKKEEAEVHLNRAEVLLKNISKNTDLIDIVLERAKIYFLSGEIHTCLNILNEPATEGGRYMKYECMLLAGMELKEIPPAPTDKSLMAQYHRILFLISHNDDELELAIECDKSPLNRAICSLYKKFFLDEDDKYFDDFSAVYPAILSLRYYLEKTRA